MADDPKSESKLRDRVAQLEAEMKNIALGMKRVQKEIDSEWGEETMPACEIQGVKFENE